MISRIKRVNLFLGLVISLSVVVEMQGVIDLQMEHTYRVPRDVSFTSRELSLGVALCMVAHRLRLHIKETSRCVRQASSPHGSCREISTIDKRDIPR